MGSLEDAWALTRVLSPRDYVQRAAEFVDGTFLNSYAAHHGLDEEAPGGPWAMWLTARPGWFRFICFDFDAKNGRPAYDAARLSYWLHEVSIAHTVTESGPTGGRHVWIALDELTPGAAVHRVARLAKQLLPSLDPSPLSETGGAVRPPGAPHRVSGSSVPHGSLQPLLTPSTSPGDVAALDALLVDLGAELEPVDVSPAHNVRKDPGGHPYLLGARRELSEYVRGLLEKAPTGDTSAAAASILAGCANARWRHDDVAALVEHSPGLEHLRTRRAGTQRLLRTTRQRARTLASTWASAVAYVSANPAAADNDPTFPTRVQSVVATIDRVQERANLTTGLWGGSRGRGVTGRGSLVFRAVLDALCVYMLQAASTEVEADTRRLAIDTGWSERRVGEVLALITTGDDSWLQRAGERTDKARGQRFLLHPKFSTEETTQTRAQVLARPTPATPPSDPLTSRALLIAELQRRLAPLRTDTFAAPHSLGRAAGHIYRVLTRTQGESADHIAEASGFTVRQVRTYLGRLVSVGLSRRSRGGWLQTHRAPEPVARTLDVDGYLERREARYRAERSRWGLWLDELRWRRQKGPHKPRRRRLEQLTLTGIEDRTRIRYPRGPGGRARHAHVLSALLALQDKRPGIRFH